MGFQLKAGESLIDGIRRITLEQIDKALTQLSDPSFNRDKAVHNARKTCKRLRAVLRLIRDEVGYEYYRQENIRFRDASRLLAPARDSAVMVETLDSLLTRFREFDSTPLPTELQEILGQVVPVPEKQFSYLRENLIQRHHVYSRQVLETDAVPQFIITFREARLNVVDWPIQQDSFNAISGGLHRVYGRGCKRMAKAAKTTTTETLHDWRKRVKYLWHQLEVIQPIWPTMLTELAEDLHTLSSYLGDEHDLAELQQLIIKTPSLLPDEQQQQQLFAMTDYRRKEYQAEAWDLGHQLYAEAPEVFVDHMQSHWNDWREKNPVRVVQTSLTEGFNTLPEEALTTRQAAKALTTTPEAVRRLIRNGRIPAFKFGRNWLIMGHSQKLKQQSTQIISTRQAAAQLGLNTRDVRKLIHTGQLPASKTGNHWAINAEDLRSLQAEHKNWQK